MTRTSSRERSKPSCASKFATTSWVMADIAKVSISAFVPVLVNSLRIAEVTPKVSLVAKLVMLIMSPCAKAEVALSCSTKIPDQAAALS